MAVQRRIHLFLEESIINEKTLKSLRSISFRGKRSGLAVLLHLYFQLLLVSPIVSSFHMLRYPRTPGSIDVSLSPSKRIGTGPRAQGLLQSTSTNKSNNGVKCNDDKCEVNENLLQLDHEIHEKMSRSKLSCKILGFYPFPGGSLG